MVKSPVSTYQYFGIPVNPCVPKNKDIVMYQYFLEGIKDGSIKAVTDAEFKRDVLLNTALGIAQRIIPRREHYLEEYGY